MKRSIELDPQFLPSYDLLAYLSLTSGTGLEDATAAVEKAVKYKPDELSMLLRLAELYSRTNKFEEAGKVAGKVMLSADDPQLKARAEGIIKYADQRRDLDKKRADAMKVFVAEKIKAP